MKDRPPERLNMSDADIELRRETLDLFDEYQFFDKQLDKLLVTHGKNETVLHASAIIQGKLTRLRENMATAIVEAERAMQEKK